MGLSNIKNSMDEFSLASSVPAGTKLKATVYLHPQEAKQPHETASDI